MADEFYTKFEQVGVFYQFDGFGTPGVAADTYTPVPAIPGSIIPDPRPSIGQSEFTGDVTKASNRARLKIDSAGILPIVSYSFYATADALIPVLAGFYQERTYTDQTTTHKFVFKLKDEWIDFAATAGYCFTIAGKNNTGDGFLLKNAIVDSFTLTIPNSGEGDARLAKCDVTWVGTQLDMGQNVTGLSATPSIPEVLNNTGSDNAFTLSFTTPLISGLCWRSYQLSGSNNVSSDCFGANGRAANYNLEPSITHTLSIPYNEDTDRFLADYKDGTALAFGFGNAWASTAAKHFAITVSYCHITGQPKGSLNNKISLDIPLMEDSDAGSWGGLTIVTATDWGI